MPRIFDNIEAHLAPALQETLELCDRADFCVGYFNLRGWRQLHDNIEKWHGGDGHCCRLLVGMQQMPQDQLRQAMSSVAAGDQIDQATAIALKKKLAQDFRDQLMVGIPTNADEDGLRRLAAQIAARKVVVKLFLRHPLHAKLYLLFRQDPLNPKIGYLGSSNLTLAGLSKQGELNVDVLDRDACDKLAKWFEDRWNDRFCMDIIDEQKDIGIRPEKLLRELGETEFIRRHQCPVRSLAAFEKSAHADDWRDLMRLYLVRRTRSFIQENYAKLDPMRSRKYLEFADGTRSYFPSRVPKTVRFKISDKDPDDQYARLFADDVVDAVNHLTLPRYGLGNYQQLKAKGIKALEGVTGDSDDPTTIAYRFSPVSNEKRDHVPRDKELRVVLATDVLSEGQNLQDCAVVVNFDLPWAIIRLIQRAGRVDRIGQQSDTILCYSFLPAEGVERIIRLRSRVRQRLQENAEVVKGTLFDLPELRHAIEDIYKFPLLLSATDTLNRQLKSGIGNQALAELVIALRQDARLCRVSENVEANEPQVICSLGLRHVSEKGAGDA